MIPVGDDDFWQSMVPEDVVLEEPRCGLRSNLLPRRYASDHLAESVHEDEYGIVP